MLSNTLDSIASGSATATPATGSAAADYLAGIPVQAIRAVAGLFGALGS